jgi:hypothetical protein
MMTIKKTKTIRRRTIPVQNMMITMINQGLKAGIRRLKLQSMEQVKGLNLTILKTPI